MCHNMLQQVPATGDYPVKRAEAWSRAYNRPYTRWQVVPSECLTTQHASHAQTACQAWPHDSSFQGWVNLSQGGECGNEAREVLQGAPELLLCCIEPILSLIQQPQLQVRAGKHKQGLIRELQVK